jgi:hypothetical protein
MQLDERITGIILDGNIKLDTILNREMQGVDVTYPDVLNHLFTPERITGLSRTEKGNIYIYANNGTGEFTQTLMLIANLETELAIHYLDEQGNSKVIYTRQLVNYKRNEHPINSLTAIYGDGDTLIYKNNLFAVLYRESKFWEEQRLLVEFSCDPDDEYCDKLELINKDLFEQERINYDKIF